MSFKDRLPLFSIIAETLDELFGSEIDSARGVLTYPALREWIVRNCVGSEARKCGLQFDPSESKVTAFLLSEDNEFIYDHSGNRISKCFGAAGMDKAVQNLFKSDTTVIIKL